MSEKRPPTQEDLILTMLRDVLTRQAQEFESRQKESPDAPRSSQNRQSTASSHATHAPPAISRRDEFASENDEPAPEPLTARELEELAEFDELAARPLAPSTLSRTLRLLIPALFAVAVLINLPLLNGVTLARALPDKQALVIRDGLLLKGSGPEFYVLQNNHKRWISSLDAFEHYGYRWENMHIVNDAFLAQFPDGPPLHVLLKCTDSPHVYRLENDKKRWIQDIPTLISEGHTWNDVRFISCQRLRSIPDGPPIPPDAGPPPQP